METCDHVFLDSNNCAKCGVSYSKLQVEVISKLTVEVATLKESRAKAVEQEQISRNECNRLRQEITELRKNFDELNAEYGRERTEHSAAVLALVSQQELNVRLERERDEAYRKDEIKMKEYNLLVRENRDLQSKCAEMREALERIRFVNPMLDKPISEQMKENEALWFHALSTDCGKGMVWISIPTKLHPKTAQLVLDFAQAMAVKLEEAQRKHGYSDGWATPDAEDWPDPLCYRHLAEHLVKGDPRDVANYCAFLWFHKLSTKPAVEGFLKEFFKGWRSPEEWNKLEARCHKLQDALEKVNGYGCSDMGHQQLCDYITEVATEALKETP